MQNLTAALAALFLLACGGSQKAEEPTAQSEEEEAAEEHGMSEEERILAAHQARQFEACEVMCTRLTECAIADTQENAPEALEDVDIDELARHYKETKCLSPCQTSELSVRQVETMEGCNEAGGTCEEFLECLDAAQPEPEQPDQG